MVIFNPGSCDCLHLYSEMHTDMLCNVECNIQVRHNPSICMNMYVVSYLPAASSARSESMRFIVTELEPVYRTLSRKCFSSPGRPVPSKISSLEFKVIVFLFLVCAARQG